MPNHDKAFTYLLSAIGRVERGTDAKYHHSLGLRTADAVRSLFPGTQSHSLPRFPLPIHAPKQRDHSCPYGQLVAQLGTLNGDDPSRLRPVECHFSQSTSKTTLRAYSILPCHEPAIPISRYPLASYCVGPLPSQPSRKARGA